MRSYNAEDYRTGKTVTESGTTTETHYIYEGNRVIMETDENGTVTARNMYGTHLASRVTGQQTCNYLYNAHGDVVLLTDASTGETKGSYVYDAFGTLIQATGDTDNSITYAGYQYDKESGLYYFCEDLSRKILKSSYKKENCLILFKQFSGFLQSVSSRKLLFSDSEMICHWLKACLCGQKLQIYQIFQQSKGRSY